MSQEEGLKHRSLNILVMRHGESNYNKMQADYAKENGLDPKYELFESRWLNREDLIDTTLSTVGEQQCVDARKMIREKYPNIKYVFVSPMRRATNTALITMEDYPGNLEWRILPWFREILLSQGDIGYYCIDFLKQHPKIDASEIGENRLWFLDYYIKDERRHDELMKEAYAAKPDVQTIVDYFRNAYPELELPVQMYGRVEKFKESIRKFIAEKEAAGVTIKDDEILLVGHSRIIRYLLGVFDLNGEIIESKEKHLNNAEVIEYSLDY